MKTFTFACLAMLILLAIKTNAEMKTTDKNPLLEQFKTPYQTTPFHLIRPEHFEPAFKELIDQSEKEFKQLISNKEKPTFENTILPIEQGADEITRLSSILFNLNSAETSPQIQEVTQKVSPMLTKFMGKIMLNKKYFERVEAVYLNRENSNFTPEQIHLVETSYLNMKRNGANLSRLKKLQLIRIQMKLSKLSLKFSENVLAETNAYELHVTDRNQLSGLPDGLLEAAAQTAKSRNKDGWVFTLQFPSYGPFMKYADNRALREQMYRASSARGNNGNKHDNNKLIESIVNLRLELAQLLGYNTYADYVLEERMADSASKVEAFLNQLHQASKPIAQKELNEVRTLAQSLGFEGELMPWDFSYYSEKLKNQSYGFDEEMVKPYFELNKVIDGVFNLSTQLYGLQFKEVKNIPVYHSDVKTYEVYDEAGKFLSILYADFHPRESKQGGAWMTEYRAQSNINGNEMRPHISICCNFTKPTDSKPSLLTFDEVTTFLHEFGHALHGMLATTVYPSMSGTNVYRDFVELPSQIHENWATEPQWLNQFARHYQTAEAIPTELIEKLIAARNFQAGYLSERQLIYGTSDLAWHTLNKPFKGSVKAFEQTATADINPFPTVEGSSFSTAFSHIFAGGYAAGYYSYKWAEVLDADAFSVFKANGIFDKATATRFRTQVLEKGGTAHPMTLYKNFRGQEPTIDALLERSGLK
jgi:peptidyl-dipeptidase Dcp